MKVTFLGTGTSHGVPVICCPCPVCISDDTKDQRLRTSVHLEINGKSIIIDTGPDFRQQVLTNSITQLDTVIFTHEHKDHTGGLDDIRGFNLFKSTPIPIYATEVVLERLRREFAYIFAEDDYPGTPQISVHAIDNQPFNVLGTTFIPIEVQHYTSTVFGFRIENFTYITDAKKITELEKKKIKGTEVLVVNALNHTLNVAHFTLQEALSLVAEIKPRQAYFTHISHELGLHQEISRQLPKRVSLAYDGLVIHV